jgi:NAD-dependent DNA ligase
MNAATSKTIDDFCKCITDKNYSKLNTILNYKNFTVLQQFIVIANMLIQQQNNENAKQFIQNIMISQSIRSKINSYSETKKNIKKMTIDDIFKFLQTNPSGNKIDTTIESVDDIMLVKIIESAERKYRNTEIGSDIYIIEDDIFDRIKSYAENSRGLIFENIVNVMEDIPDSLTKVVLDIPMGSMDKVKLDSTDADFNRQLKLKLDKQGKNVNKFLIQSKLDGLSGLFKFDTKDGKTEAKFFNRGSGTEGADISHLINYINYIPKAQDLLKSVGKNKTIYVKGEIIMKIDTFNKNYPDASNARNTGTGIVLSDPPVALDKLRKSRDLDFIAFELDEDRGDKLLDDAITQNEKLVSYGFKPVKSEINSREDVGSIEYLENKLEQFITTSEYTIDGIIVKAVTPYQRLEEGNPTNAFAFKKDKEGVETTVTSIDWNLSKLGVYNPTINFTPINIDGKSTKKATGHNYKYLLDNNIYPGARAKVVYAGSVIPKITGNRLTVITDENRESIVSSIETLDYDVNGNTVEPYKNYKFKTSEKIEIIPKIYTKQFFANEIFPSKLLSLAKTLDMKKIGPKTFEIIGAILQEKFTMSDSLDNINNNCAPALYTFLSWDSSLVDVIEDLGSDKASASRKNILTFIEKILTASDEKIASGFNILGGNLSTKTIQKLSELKSGLYNTLEFTSNEENKTEALKELSNISGIGQITAVQFIKNSSIALEFLDRIHSIKKAKNITNVKEDNDKNPKRVYTEIQKVPDGNFVMTGKRDKDIQKAIEDSGRKIASQVSGQTRIGIYAIGSEAKANRWKEKFPSIITKSHDEFKEEYMK